MDPEDLRRALASRAVDPFHLSPSDLGAYLAGDRSEAREDHLARCAECRTALEDLHRRRRVPWRSMAAAVLVLAALGGWRLSRPAAPAGASASRPQAPALREIQAGRSVLVTLAEGTSARVSGTTVRLERGRLKMESPGEEALLEALSLRVTLSEGELLAEVLPPRSALLLREARAGEGAEVRLTLRSGTARIAERVLKPGDSIGAPLSWTDGWIRLPDAGEIRDASRILLPDPPEQGWILEALVRKRTESAELGAVFSLREAPVGANLLGAGEGWNRLRISVSPSRCRVQLGERTVADLPPSALPCRLPPGSSGGAGIRAWGGAVEMKDARWRPLP